MEKSNINFGNMDDDAHKCYGEQEGDWVVFRCPVCEDYERRINLKTGEMKSQYDKDNVTQHHGFYMKPGLDSLSYSSN